MSNSAGTPRVLITTGTELRTTQLLREDAVTGRNYSQAVTAAGGLAIMVAALEPAQAGAYVDLADALLLSGGVDVDPAQYGAVPAKELGRVDGRRDAFELALYRAFRAAGKPILGICRGLQIINVAEGGTLHQHLPALPQALQHEQVDPCGAPLHPLALAPESGLARAFGRLEIRVNSYHHQAIDRLADTLVAAATSPDGLVEAFEAKSGGYMLGVQWHPEMAFQDHPEQRAPFDLLMEAAGSLTPGRLLVDSPA